MFLISDAWSSSTQVQNEEGSALNFGVFSSIPQAISSDPRL